MIFLTRHFPDAANGNSEKKTLACLIRRKIVLVVRLRKISNISTPAPIARLMMIDLNRPS